MKCSLVLAFTACLPFCAWTEHGTEASVARMQLSSAERKNALGMAKPADESPHCIGGVCFLARAHTRTEKLPLMGISAYRYGRGNLYYAALYAPPAFRYCADHCGSVPRKLVLHYSRHIPAKAIEDETFKVLDGQGIRVDQEIDRQLRRINRAYGAVGAGDRVELTYVPQLGTTLSRNGREKLTVPGARFAAVYFDIWLGTKNPLSGALRDALFGVSEESMT